MKDALDIITNGDEEAIEAAMREFLGMDDED